MVKRATKRTLNLAVQAGQFQKHFPASSVSIRKSELMWYGTLMPSPLSATYKIRVRYKLRKRPNVEVLEPKLEKRDGKKPPHLFPGDRLCLYLADEWHSSMLLVDTIVPWTAEWLVHYEIWLATGEWCGGGVHPAITSKRRERADSSSAATSHPMDERTTQGRPARRSKWPAR